MTMTNVIKLTENEWERKFSLKKNEGTSQKYVSKEGYLYPVGCRLPVAVPGSVVAWADVESCAINDDGTTTVVFNLKTIRSTKRVAADDFCKMLYEQLVRHAAVDEDDDDDVDSLPSFMTKSTIDDRELPRFGKRR